jgi:hypothetical protein
MGRIHLSVFEIRNQLFGNEEPIGAFLYLSHRKISPPNLYAATTPLYGTIVFMAIFRTIFPLPSKFGHQNRRESIFHIQRGKIVGANQI